MIWKWWKLLVWMVVFYSETSPVCGLFNIIAWCHGFSLNVQKRNLSPGLQINVSSFCIGREIKKILKENIEKMTRSTRLTVFPIFPQTFVPTRFLTGPNIRAHIKWPLRTFVLTSNYNPGHSCSYQITNRTVVHMTIQFSNVK